MEALATLPLRPTAMRLDLYLYENGLAQSRTEAKTFITAGIVTVNGKTVTKPSFDILEGEVRVENTESVKKYVSRGGFKLECAIKNFDFAIEGRLALDVGASSGGFTDCLLKNGAKRVIAVDSGCGQLAEALRKDDRVISIENYNARYMKPSDLEFIPELAVMDVSFISATYIIPSVFECIAPGGDFICLIKPQFEVGKSLVGKGGIVKDEKARAMAVDKVVSFVKMIGFTCLGTTVSDITGGDGNTEFLAHFRK